MFAPNRLLPFPMALLLAGAALALAQPAPGGSAQADAAPAATAATRDDTRAASPPAADLYRAGRTAREAPKLQPFSLRRIPADEEPWDPSWQIDPRIARFQRWNAPN